MLDQARPLPWSWLLSHDSVWCWTLRARHIKIPSVCLDAFHYRVSHSNCWPCLSPSPQSHPLPSLRAVPPCECGSVPPRVMPATRSVTAGAGGCRPPHSFCLPAQNRDVSSCPWESPCHRHISTAKSSRHPGPASVGSPGASWGPRGPRIVGMWKLVGMAAAEDPNLVKSISHCWKKITCTYFFNADGFIFPCKPG